MVLKEKFGVINLYIYKNIGHVVLNVYAIGQNQIDSAIGTNMIKNATRSTKMF